MQSWGLVGACSLVLVASSFACVACGPLPDEDALPATAIDAEQVPVSPPQAGVPPGEQTVAVDPAADVYADSDPSALTDFHAALDPHGSWVEDPTFGTVWVPNPAEVGPDFAPYETAGHWSYDDDDYTWCSDYAWGWAPFHYGRWMYGSLGWVWIPGRVYSPAWVSWRVGAPGYAYVGWAPMAASYYWRGGVAMETAPMAVAPEGYRYVAHADVFARSVGERVIPRTSVAQVAASTQVYGGGGVAGTRGPAPSLLGIPASAVTHGSASDKGVAQARAFAHPSTAKELGGHPPTQHRIVTARPRVGGSRGPHRSGGGHGGGGHGGHR